MNKPLIIGIGGTHSGAGKTTLAVSLLKYLTKGSKALSVMGSEVKYSKLPQVVDQTTNFEQNTSLVTRHASLVTNRRWGAIKCAKTSSPPSIVTDKKILMGKNKDTWNMMRAGASEVLWVKSPRSSLNKVLPETVKRLSHLDGIIVEGNSAIEFLKPDIVIFIVGGDKKLWKPGIERLITITDIILHENKAELPKISKTTKLFHKSLSDKKEYKGFFELISNLLMKKELKEELNKKAVNRKLSCAAARKIAEELGVSYKKVGAAADKLGIKIRNCQLGCF